MKALESLESRIIIAVLFLWFYTSSVFGAEVSFNSATTEININQLFEADVLVNTGDELINAIEGKITFPYDLLEIKTINDGNSIINFWVEKPHQLQEGGRGEIVFAGITPGGYSGRQGLILSITFLTKKEGVGTIAFDSLKVLRNDGKGTEIPLTISSFQFVVTKQSSSFQVIFPSIEDNNPPEDFTPQIVSDSAIFEGKWFLVFATQDKGSGIDHYEVCEGRKKCVIAESPYLLKNQKLNENITVKAIDKNGNERVIILPPQRTGGWYKYYETIAILIMALVLYIIWKFLCRKHKK